ncbi:MAG: HEPN domain-containing protein [Nanoarchaeota archaeon]|nr:HEPN domain-containing protein [Nanoarchaeota archaeon]
MDSNLSIHRAENEYKLAGIIFKISENPELQTKTFGIRDPETYFSAVISHSYYSIFFAAKAYLLKKGIAVVAPEEHRKAYEAFKGFVDSGELDVELLKIYQQALVRAEVLLGIFKEEKKKRGTFTYRILPQANREPARESMEHAKIFLNAMQAVCEKR